jgi:hypothetical protein
MRAFLKLYGCQKIGNFEDFFFQQISSSTPNFPKKFFKFQIQVLVMFCTTNNVTKMLLCIKIRQEMAEISTKEGSETCKDSNKL